MHTGDAASLRAAQERGHAIAEKIAELLAEAETLAPGSTAATPGQIRVIGTVVRRRIDGWEIQA
ncbi:MULTISPECIES: hypothetical protein [unclassified Streptomyces]|uniref:hypothetical protein n=1 Tax=unclassified Streptomyces TaxID=2593676 RepID=UPI002251A073|nr:MULTISPECIES: hypothetical protein [unclassified Streptomyces]MCX4871116.1 hypothetical protein [Streptomyces sp. NBC_00906]MCX4902738.1 hypothetical protein [Streptomyces sp. NBC_00892]